VHILNSLLPVFLMIALGAVLKQSGFMSREMIKGGNALAYWVGLPCMLFLEIAKGRVSVGPHLDAFLTMGIGVGSGVALAYLAAWLLRAGKKSTGSFVQACFRSNAAYIGLSILLFSVSADEVEHTLALGALMLAFIVPLYNVTAVVVLAAGREPFNRKTMGVMTRQILTNPLIIASVLGGLYAICFDSMPKPLDRTLEGLGRMALPLALLGVGASLNLQKLRGNARLVGFAALIRLALVPLVAYAASRLLGLDQAETRVVLIFMACPTAAASYVLADQMGGDGELAAGIVALTTLLSFFSLSAAVWVTM
jgi:predicted permease